MLVGLRKLAIFNDGIRYSLFPEKYVYFSKYLEREGIKVNFSAAGPGTPFPSASVDLMADAKILLNGHDRFATRPQTYFRLVQPWQCHTRVPSKHIYVYSFGIRPEEHQPSGTCNFSRIDNAQLVMDLTNPANFPASVDYANWPNRDGVLYIFAPNYNVFRVMSGMGGLAYSN